MKIRAEPYGSFLLAKYEIRKEKKCYLKLLSLCVRVRGL